MATEAKASVALVFFSWWPGGELFDDIFDEVFDEVFVETLWELRCHNHFKGFSLARILFGKGLAVHSFTYYISPMLLVVGLKLRSGVYDSVCITA